MNANNDEIVFSKEEKETLLNKLQGYCANELDIELSHFDAEFLIQFILKEMGAHFYNQGLLDAQAILMNKLDTITEAISEIEKPTD